MKFISLVAIVVIVTASLCISGTYAIGASSCGTTCTTKANITGSVKFCKGFVDYAACLTERTFQGKTYAATVSELEKAAELEYNYNVAYSTPVLSTHSDDCLDALNGFSCWHAFPKCDSGTGNKFPPCVSICENVYKMCFGSVPSPNPCLTVGDSSKPNAPLYAPEAAPSATCTGAGSIISPLMTTTMAIVLFIGLMMM